MPKMGMKPDLFGRKYVFPKSCINSATSIMDVVKEGKDIVVRPIRDEEAETSETSEGAE
jgi:hypothetical protein